MILSEDETITHAVAALVRDGFSVLGAASAAQALDALAANAHGICALVADVHLDGPIDGFALANRARALKPDLAVLMISACSYPDAATRLPYNAPAASSRRPATRR